MKSTLLLALLHITAISSYCQIYTPEVKVMQTPNGNVGIGTDSPDAAWFADQALQISGVRPTLSFTPTLPDGFATIQWLGKTPQSQIQLNYLDTDNSLSFYSYTANKDIIKVRGSGHIGINKSDPVYHVDMGGTAPTIRLKDDSEQPTWGLNITQKSDLSGAISMAGRDLTIDFGWNKKLFLGVSQHAQYDGQVIVPGANMGIGTSNPSYKLDVNGSIRYTSGGLNGSDRRWKKDISAITSASAILNKVRPVSYRWRTEEFPDKNFDERLHYGVIAQELEEILPDLVDKDNEGYNSVDYIGLIGILIQGHQEKELEIEKLKSELQAMKSSQQQNLSVLLELTARFDRLENTATTSKNIND